MTPRIRAGTTADYEGILKRVLAAFADSSPAHAPFDLLYPDCIRPDAACMQDWVLAEAASGEIVAGVQIVPRPMRLAGGIRVRAAGIGQVFCLPAHRKGGLMTALLEAAVAKMDRDGYDVSLLGGDRRRYRRQGWEVAGSMVAARLGSRSIRAVEPPPAGQELPPPRRWHGEAEDFPKLYAAWQALPTRGERSPDMHAAVLRRFNVWTWIQECPAGFAYVVLRGDQVAEYAGDRPALQALLGHLVQRTSLRVRLPPAPVWGELEPMILDFAGWYAVEPAGMARIFSVRRVLTAWEPLLRRRLAGWSGRLRLRVTETGEQTILAGTDAGPVVLDTPARDAASGPGRDGVEIALSLPEMAALLFGPVPPPALPETVRECEAVRRAFPLPLGWPALDEV